MGTYTTTLTHREIRRQREIETEREREREREGSPLYLMCALSAGL